jgi:dTDP-glucose 4,6-dehydratase
MQKCLIAGSAGNIGTQFVRKAIYERQPLEFASIDKIVSRSSLNNIYMHKDYKFYLGNIVDAHILDVIFEQERPSTIIHAAEEQFGNTMVQSNLLGTYNLLEAAKKWGVSHFIYLSSDKIYGSLKDENTKQFSEKDIPSPNNQFAGTKAAAEMMVSSFGLPFNIIRLPNVYGIRQGTSNFVQKTMKSVLKDSPVVIHNQGKEVRDWLHIYDVCSAILTILYKGEKNTIYNIGGAEISNLELANRIYNLMEKSVKEQKIIFADRIGQDFRRSSSNALLKSLGWSPYYKLNEGLIDTINWLQKNPGYLN